MAGCLEALPFFPGPLSQVSNPMPHCLSDDEGNCKWTAWTIVDARNEAGSCVTVDPVSRYVHVLCSVPCNVCA